jgi:hypothetical protein
MATRFAIGDGCSGAKSAALVAGKAEGDAVFDAEGAGSELWSDAVAQPTKLNAPSNPSRRNMISMHFGNYTLGSVCQGERGGGTKAKSQVSWGTVSSVPLVAEFEVLPIVASLSKDSLSMNLTRLWQS